MRVEHALRLLPAVEALDPLRRTLLASAAPDAAARWGSAAPYLTVGKWLVSLERFREAIPDLLHRTADHLGALCRCYADALECEERGDPGAAVLHLLRAAHLEERAGRFGAARRWAEAALDVAEGLNSRRTEIETLTFLGDLCRAEAQYTIAGRHYQRALVLAEAEFDRGGVVEAAMRLGFVALAEGDLSGAELWLGRAERLAKEAGMTERRARAQRAAAETARRQGDLARAEARLKASREALEAADAPLELARTLDAQGLMEQTLGKTAAAQVAFREALAWERRSARDSGLECGIHLHLAELLLASGQDAAAEEEMRRAERVAIGDHLGRQLAQVYTRLGALRGRQGDDTGFVFFEQALSLCLFLDPAPALEAEVCRQYGHFKAALGRPEEAHGWLERAHELLVAVGGGAALEALEEEMGRLKV